MLEARTSTSTGLPPITQIAFLTCRAQYPGGPNRCVSVSSLSARPSPVNWRVGIHDFTFEACSSFTRVTACRVAARPKADVCPEASIRLVKLVLVGPGLRPRRRASARRYLYRILRFNAMLHSGQSYSEKSHAGIARTTRPDVSPAGRCPDRAPHRSWRATAGAGR